MVLETERLILRPFMEADIEGFAPIEADPEVMRFYRSGPRSREQTARNIAWYIELQAKHGHSLWAVIHKADQLLIGYCGLLSQQIDGESEVEIGYKLARQYWGQGLATEAARAVRDWGFAHLPVPHLISIIDPENRASIRVAEKNGMTLWKEADYHGKLCSIYRLTRPQ